MNIATKKPIGSTSDLTASIAISPPILLVVGLVASARSLCKIPAVY
jgi:hypothetical protein